LGLDLSDLPLIKLLNFVLNLTALTGQDKLQIARTSFMQNDVRNLKATLSKQNWAKTFCFVISAQWQ
jgi:hypothetical protein